MWSRLCLLRLLLQGLRPQLRQLNGGLAFVTRLADRRHVWRRMKAEEVRCLT